MADSHSLLKDLSRLLLGRDHVVWVTGAGLSVASGVPTYRLGSDALWDRFVTDWGTVERFREDPRTWWRDFWVKAHPPATLEKEPNAGHRAITELLARAPGHTLVTQNIDGLHRKAGVPEAQLIEIHGRMGRYRCLQRRCAQWRQVLTLDVDETALAQDTTPLPVCPGCGEPVMPLVLLFDEQYTVHPYFQFPRAEQALARADAVLFVGTSFSVGITALACQAALQAGAPMYNFNIRPEPRMTTILGPSEETLPELARLCRG